jgi:hypothetical protein
MPNPALRLRQVLFMLWVQRRTGRQNRTHAGLSLGDHQRVGLNWQETACANLMLIECYRVTGEWNSSLLTRAVLIFRFTIYYFPPHQLRM